MKYRKSIVRKKLHTNQHNQYHHFHWILKEKILKIIIHNQLLKKELPNSRKKLTQKKSYNIYFSLLKFLNKLKITLVK